MPSAKNRTASRRANSHRNAQVTSPSVTRTGSANHVAFFPLVVLVFLVWVIYRSLFREFPVWFDEIIGKAIFFGLPVWLYVTITRARSITDTLAPERLNAGLLVGLAVGGIFGFAATLTTLLTRHVVLQAAPVFASDGFWWQFLLALMTGFWETLFFYSWMMVVVQEKMKKWSLVNQVLLVSVLFLAFHLPNMFLRFPLYMIPGQIILLFFFAVGQAFLFARSRNLYALTLSHAIWGMVLVVHTR